MCTLSNKRNTLGAQAQTGMVVAVFRNLAGVEKQLEVADTHLLLQYVKPKLCEAYGKLSSFQVELVNEETLESFKELDDTPFALEGSAFQVLFSWRSLWDGKLRGLPELKNVAHFEGHNNPPESALAGGGYTTPQMREKWHNKGGLSFRETLRLIERAIPHRYSRGPWIATVRRSMRIRAVRLTEANVRSLEAVLRCPTDIGPHAQSALLALRTYLRFHEIGMQPRVRRLRRKTKPLSLKNLQASVNYSATLERQ